MTERTKYRVFGTYTEEFSVVVDADSPGEAEDAAQDAEEVPHGFKVDGVDLVPVSEPRTVTVWPGGATIADAEATLRTAARILGIEGATRALDVFAGEVGARPAPCAEGLRYRLAVLALRDARALAGDAAFRAPHHTASRAAYLQEVAMAKGGVLYLEQIEEVRRSTVEAIALMAAQLGGCTIVVSPRPEAGDGPTALRYWETMVAILNHRNREIGT